MIVQKNGILQLSNASVQVRSPLFDGPSELLPGSFGRRTDSIVQLGVRTPVAGSAGYVAMELVTGKLDGRSGSFAVQRAGTMRGGTSKMVLTIVPDSGTGELTGLTGNVEIIIAEGGKHSYKFDYQLPKAP